MKIYNSIFGKILLGSILSAIATISVVGYISQQRVTDSFDTFVTRRDALDESDILNKPPLMDMQGRKRIELVNEFKNTVTVSISFASLIGITVSTVISFFVSRQISQPLSELQKKLRKLKRNKYQLIQEGTSSMSEIENLIGDFNDLIKELHRVDSLRDELVSDVTHELKTPLTKIMGQLEGAIDGVYSFDKPHANKVLDNVHQLEYLLSQLEKLTQIRAGKVKLEKSDVLLANLLDSLFSGYSKAGVKISHLVSSAATIHADPYKLREILDNLISNAIRHTKKGSITVTFTSGVLKIKDTGEGIPHNDIPYIFERFYRADKSRNQKTGGLGLGLSIVKELVELHGWKISVSSSKGRGTSFLVKVG